MTPPYPNKDPPVDLNNNDGNSHNNVDLVMANINVIMMVIMTLIIMISQFS